MDWITELSGLEITKIAPTLGLSLKRMQSIGPCPACNAEKRGSSDPRGPIGLTPNRLGFMCHKCKVTGDNLDLISLCVSGGKFREIDGSGKDRVREYCGGQGWIRRSAGGVSMMHISKTHKSLQTVNPTPPKPQKVYKGIFAWAGDKPILYKNNLYSEDGKGVLNYLLVERKLDPEVVQNADLGCVWQDINGHREYWISIPLKDPSGNIVNMRFRSVPPAKKQYRVCPAQPLPLFGASDLDRRNDTVIITEGELDVLAMRTYGFTNIVSGTAGATANWKEEWLDCLEQYKSFILLYDDDQAGEEGAAKLAESLGQYRCFRSKIMGYNDPNEALIDGAPVEDIERDLKNFESYVESKLCRVDEFAAEFEELILNPNKSRGIATGSGKLDHCLGGIRRGLWVITGDTGAGKSTWANWLCYEMAKKDVPIVLTSFENKPIGAVQKLMRMHLGGDYTKNTQSQRAQALRDLGNMPIYIMNHYGEIDRQATIDRIRYAARRHGAKIALIDHLGFLATGNDQQDERQLLEETVRILALNAVQDDITIMLICHPNNTSVYQNRRVKITDLKGASAIRQDAHVGIVVERQDNGDHPMTNLYFDKVRSEFGRAGSQCSLGFDPLSCIYADEYSQTPSGQKGKKPIQPAQQRGPHDRP